MIVSDLSLARKLERTEARANIDFVDTRARLETGSGAEWIEIGGAFAMFDGVESPLTQTFGLGVFEDATPEQLATLEEFFKDRGAPVFHEVSPMADPSLLALLGDSGYRPIELTSVMYQELPVENPRQTAPNPAVSTRIIDGAEAELWARTSADGWSTENPELSDFMFNFGTVSARCQGAFPYIAELEGQPVATGMLFLYDDVCMLAGASTIPSARKRGAQAALLRDRLKFAAEHGSKLAIMGAAPGSQSQLNGQRAGFRIAYTRIKWQLIE